MALVVLRIETNDGVGAYSAGANWDYSDEGYPGVSAHHPSPDDDYSLAVAWRSLGHYGRIPYFFGFKDEAQMRAWFYCDKWLEAMKKADLKLTKWEVAEEDALIGHTQVVFRRNKAILIGTDELI